MERVILTENGLTVFLSGDKVHRIDGPALLFPDGNEIWVMDDLPWDPPAHIKLAWAASKAA